jgi:hypothetical protein
MEKKVLFRDYQEQQAADHTDLQDFAQNSFDHLVYDAVTKSRRYAGFNTVKSSQAEVQVAGGRFYDADGAIYNKAATTTQSMLAYLPAVSQRIVLVTASGAEVDTEVEERDFLVNVDTGQTEPDAVATVRERAATINFVTGAESADPQSPAIPSTHVAIARIVLDATQVVSVTMLEDYEVASTEDLDARTDSIEDWKTAVEPRVNALASDLSDLARRVNGMAGGRSIIELKKDMARVKEALEFPEGAAGYGADRFLDIKSSDTTNASTLGYDAAVMEGIRFPDANADEFEISLFSNNDPNASVTNGVLLPKYSNVFKVANWHGGSSLGIAQYGFQNITMKEGYMSRTRVRHSDTLLVCNNGYWYYTEGVPTWVGPQNLYDLESTEVETLSVEWIDPNNPQHIMFREDGFWIDNWKEPFMYAQTTNHAISGAMVAQTFLAPSDFWMTRVGFNIVQKGGASDIKIAICEVTNGMPDTNKTMALVTYPHASIVMGWNFLSVPPTFLQKGKLYALCLVSNANHEISMSSGVSSNTYLQGTFFYSTDGQYYIGDLTKDMSFTIEGAYFHAPQVAIEFQPINLDGGFRYIDILSHMWVPASTELVFEVRPSGAGAWLPLTKDTAGALATAPPLAQFRARFIGTTDMQPAIKLTGSRVKVARPKLAFRHVSKVLSCPSTTAITVVAQVEGFNDTPHDLSCRIHSNGIYVNPASTVVKQISNRPLHEFTWTFNPTATTSFRIEFNGATNSAQNTFHISERVFYTE